MAGIIAALDEPAVRNVIGKIAIVEHDPERAYRLRCWLDYYRESHQILNEADMMMAVTAGATLDENIDFRVYYTPADRGYQKHRLLGLYHDKTVRFIGEIENVVIADDAGGHLIVHDSTAPVTADHSARIMRAVASAPGHGWNISKGCMFFLVYCFVKTDFKKVSRGGLRGKKYFSLREELGLEQGSELPDISKIAAELSARTWE